MKVNLNQNQNLPNHHQKVLVKKVELKKVKVKMKWKVV